jgi:hypothetical protein
MSLYETKYCPRCRKPFECKPGNITQCQCFEVELSSLELELIRDVYDDCLCVDCLLELKERIKKYKNNVKTELLNTYIRGENGYHN